jgi:hypothetical protein
MKKGKCDFIFINVNVTLFSLRVNMIKFVLKFFLIFYAPGCAFILKLDPAPDRWEYETLVQR